MKATRQAVRWTGRLALVIGVFAAGVVFARRPARRPKPEERDASEAPDGWIGRDTGTKRPDYLDLAQFESA